MYCAKISTFTAGILERGLVRVRGGVIFIYICVCMYMYVYICMYITRMYIYVCTYIYIHTYIKYITRD